MAKMCRRPIRKESRGWNSKPGVHSVSKRLKCFGPARTSGPQRSDREPDVWYAPQGVIRGAFRSVLQTPICGKLALRRPMRAFGSVKAVGTSNHRLLDYRNENPNLIVQSERFGCLPPFGQGGGARRHVLAVHLRSTDDHYPDSNGVVLACIALSYSR
jgi:hypothetical protein